MIEPDTLGFWLRQPPCKLCSIKFCWKPATLEAVRLAYTFCYYCLVTISFPRPQLTFDLVAYELWILTDKRFHSNLGF